jgi:hypothetical protein
MTISAYRHKAVSLKAIFEFIEFAKHAPYITPGSVDSFFEVFYGFLIELILLFKVLDTLFKLLYATAIDPGAEQKQDSKTYPHRSLSRHFIFLIRWW